MNIGEWIRRRRPGSKWHVVESIVADDAVTKCGRRMDAMLRATGLDHSTVMPLTRMIGQPQLCKRCA